MDSETKASVEKAVLDERNRCIACVESQMHLAGDDKYIRSTLTRIANLIRSGESPKTFEPFKG